jgi:DNA-binding transcriptional ArsR family regulator
METVALAEVAAVLADPSRATMCLALLDGRAWTIGELAAAARIAVSTASEHVAKLHEAGFVARVKQGRHAYVRIADAHVAELIEHLAQHAEHREPVGLTASVRARRLAFARSCYDHLAGTVGVALREGLIANGLVDTAAGLALTDAGRAVLEDLGVAVPAGGRRPMLRECLDWTERRDHLGGAVPAAILDRAVAAGWLTRDARRTVRLRPSAREPFAALGVDLATLSANHAP